jgi:WD40 repeat protein/predicted Ser/Thr protein kinase
MQECPAPDRLQALLAGELVPEEQATVEAHLAGCTGCQRLLDELTDLGLDQWRRLMTPPPDTLPIFTASLTEQTTWTLGLPENRPVAPVGYEVLEELGRGGMGIVYKARQRSLNRLVALKVMMEASGASAADRERFRREAEAAALLHHPNVVQVYEVGEASGQLFLAMEHVAGGTLADRLAGTPRPAREAAELVEILARAMQFAHEQGVVHRDLKPANILLTEQGVPKVGDFGLARLLESSVGPTRTSDLLGTPSYMAPEQAAARHAEVGPRTDVWALGAILYECLTGRPPFKAALPLLTLQQVVHHDPATPCRLVPGVPRDLETICLKCLAKESAGRYQSAGELADDLRRFLDGRPVLARPVGPITRVWKWARANPLPSSLAALVIVTLVTGILVASILAAWALERSATAESEGRALASANKQLGVVVGQLQDAKGTLERRVEELGLALYSSQVARIERALDDNNRIEARALLLGCAEDLRNWEWRHLWRRLEGSRVTLEGNSSPVICVAYSRDGRNLAAGTSDGTLRIWAVPSLQEPIVCKGSARPILGLGFSPDGTQVVAAGADAVLRIWDVASGEQVRSWPSQAQDVLAVAYSPNGRRLVSSCREALQFWDPTNGREVSSVLPGRWGSDVAYLPDGRAVAACSDGTMRVWEDDVRENRLPVPAGVAWSSVAVRPDGKRVAAAGGRQSGRYLVWVGDVITKETIVSFDEPNMVGGRLTFTADGKQLVTPGHDGALRTWDAETGKLGETLLGHVQRVYQVTASPDGQLASAGWDGTVKVWGGTPAPRVNIPHGTVAAFSPDGKILATGGLGPRVHSWDPVTGGELTEYQGHFKSVSALAVGPGMIAAAAGDGDSEVRVWETESGQGLAYWSFPRTHITAIAFEPGGGRLIVGTHDTLRLLPLAPEMKDARLRFRGVQAFLDIAVAPDGQMALATPNRGVIVCTPTGVRVRGGDKEEESRAVAFSRDGRWLAATGDGYIQVQDARTGSVRFTLPVQGRPNSVAFSPDGTRLAGDDKSGVKLWELETGLLVLTLRDPSMNQAGFRVCFSPDGRRLALCNRTSSVTIWDAGVGHEVHK